MEQRNEDGRHHSRLSENAGNLNRCNAYRVLGSYSQNVEPSFSMTHALRHSSMISM